MTKYGDAVSQSALSELVGVTCAVASKMVLDDLISQRGIVTLISKHIAEPMFVELTRLGVKPENHTTNWIPSRLTERARYGIDLAVQGHLVVAT